ncbi:MAG: metal-dependent transcriptional regulator [Deltaproteobacteria bacterium]|nr:metal-dependent transcriptional regulator [Deltaproteobacteria bacterium]
MSSPLLLLLGFGLGLALVVAVFWPRWGVVSQVRRGHRASLRVGMEDALKHLYTCARLGREATVESVAGALEVTQATAARILQELRDAHLVRPDRFTVLSEEGSQYALRIIRTHRLWERYLADRTGVAPGEWHDRAEVQEHLLSHEAVEALDARLGRPRFDPHGHPIPTAAGDLPAATGVPLTHLDPGEEAVITHLEDRPRALYVRLVREGLSPGMHLRIRGLKDGRIHVSVDGRPLALDAALASNIMVIAPEGTDISPSAAWDGLTLEDLKTGDVCRVVGLSPACQGIQRRRLLDLGVVPGTPVEVAFTATAGDPTAYRIRGALIAFRREQQRWVRIRRTQEATA